MAVFDSSFRRRHLPHYDVAHGMYFVTACLAGSIPAHGLQQMRDANWCKRERERQDGIDDAQRKRERQWQAFTIGDGWLDQQPVVRWLSDPRLAAVVRDEILRHAGVIYDLHAHVIMPSHMHLVFSPRMEWFDQRGPRHGPPRAVIMRLLKGGTGRACNLLLRRDGPFWQSESYDRLVRDADELERIVRYVEYNPVKAGLCRSPEDWPFSSAKQDGLGPVTSTTS